MKPCQPSSQRLNDGSLSATQIIQRQLEQVEEKQRQLEERGVAVEKALRGEAGTSHLTVLCITQGS